MNLDHTQAQAQNVLDIRHDVGGVPRMQAATRDQALGIVLSIVGDKLIHRGREADHFGRYIVDLSSPVNAATIQIFQKSFRRTAILFNLIEVGALTLHQCKRMRLEEFNRFDVDVAVGDQGLGR